MQARRRKGQVVDAGITCNAKYCLLGAKKKTKSPTPKQASPKQELLKVFARSTPKTAKGINLFSPVSSTAQTENSRDDDDDDDNDSLPSLKGDDDDRAESDKGLEVRQ